ncbi:MAG: fibronectin type III domain-containing protein, partial [Steroidobacteraceae bacterium]
SRRGVYFCAVAALGLALSACGGGSNGTSADASPVQSSQPAQSSMPSQSTSASTSAPSTSTDSGTTTASTGSSSTSSSPPTATAGAVTINWQPPTENIDGSSLTNLAGYNIHYGTASGKYTQTITVSNPGLATYVVSSLTPGTYYFTVAAVNSSGTESPLSSEVSTTVN